MSRRVPSCDLDDDPASLKFTVSAYSNSSMPSLEYEVAELTWENGQLAMHGLGPSRGVNKPPPASPATWDKPHAGGTLESIVNQATGHPHHIHGGKNNANDLAPWFDHPHATASATMTMDALVPCSKNNQENSSHVLESVPVMATCMVGSCSAAATEAAPRGGRFARCCCRTNVSVSESATFGGRESRQVTLDSCDREFAGSGFTSTTLWTSPENTSSDKEYTRTSGEDHDSVCHSRTQREAGDKCKNKRNGIAAKSRAAAIHNQSERKRRDKINQRMKTLQKLVPNSSKTDKASMLDEVIEYLKQLQAQVNMMSCRMNMPLASMMLPLQMQQQLQMSMMGMGMGMGIPTAASAAFMPMAGSWDMQAGVHVQPLMPDLMSAFLACQSQPMTMDAHSRLAALYQQFQRAPPGSASKNNS